MSHRKIRSAIAVVLTSLVLATFPMALPATADDHGLELTILSTTDVHGRALNWDYFQDSVLPPGNELGLARAATLVNGVRAAKGEESVLLVDNGDFIQGTPLTYLYGMREPVNVTGALHPMASALNTMGYDAQVVGNHEYNYGLELLDAYDAQTDAPLLGANAIDVSTGESALDPWVLIDREIEGETVTIGVLGVVTPGVRIWDKQYVDGVLEFEDPVLSAQKHVPGLKAAGAHVVVVLAHSGLDPEGREWNPVELPENVATSIAEQVPDIDLVVVGHSHQDIPATYVTNIEGGQTLLTQPVFWAQSVSEATFNLVPDGEGFSVDWTEGNQPTAQQLYTAGDVAEDPDVVAAVSAEHALTVEYVNTTVAHSVEELRTESSRYEDTPIIDFINTVQTNAVRDGLAGTDYEDHYVISAASPFSRTAVFPQGPVTIRDMAGLYVFDNTLRGVELTGAQLKDYLEFAAGFFVQQEVGATFDPETGTNAWDAAAGRGRPDYTYDVIDGLNYVIDLTEPEGERITLLQFPDGTAVADDDLFVLGVNNYRQSGGSGYPHVSTAPIIYDELQEIRQLMIDFAADTGTIDPADFASINWYLTTEPLPEGGSFVPSPTPTPPPTESTPTAPVEEHEDTELVVVPPSPYTDWDPAKLPSAGAQWGLLGISAALLAVLVGGGLLVWRSRRPDDV